MQASSRAELGAAKRAFRARVLNGREAVDWEAPLALPPGVTSGAPGDEKVGRTAAGLQGRWPAEGA